MSIIPIREYCNMTNNISIHEYFQSIYEYLILFRNVYREWVYISLWFSLPGKFFKGQIYKSQEKEIIKIIYEKKIYFRYS